AVIVVAVVAAASSACGGPPGSPPGLGGQSSGSQGRVDPLQVAWAKHQCSHAPPTEACATRVANALRYPIAWMPVPSTWRPKGGLLVDEYPLGHYSVSQDFFRQVID